MRPFFLPQCRQTEAEPSVAKMVAVIRFEGCSAVLLDVRHAGQSPSGPGVFFFFFFWSNV